MKQFFASVGVNKVKHLLVPNITEIIKSLQQHACDLYSSNNPAEKQT